MAPVRDTVRFVHNQKTDLVGNGEQDRSDKFIICKTFGRNQY